MAMEFTQPVTKRVPEDISGVSARPARKADNLAAIYEPIV
jgi:hypothetical protein